MPRNDEIHARLDANRLGIAAAIASALLYAVCYAIVAIAPAWSMSLTGYIFHMEMADAGWALSWGGFAIGLIVTALLAYLTLWLLGVTYNGLLRGERRVGEPLEA